MPNLTKRLVDAAEPTDVEFFIWCSSTPGFGVRVYPSGKRVFVCQVRVGRATRRVKIGVYGAYTVDQARQRAQEIIRAAAEGRDPQREKMSVAHELSGLGSTRVVRFAASARRRGNEPGSVATGSQDAEVS